MDLRITLQTIVDRALSYSRTQTDALGKLQEQISSGKRINQPEDDPLGSVAVLNARAQEIRLESDLTNINTAKASLNIGVSSLQAANRVFIKARELAIEGSSSTNDPNALNALATEVDALYNQLVEIANTQDNGQYIFGGARTDTVPFATGPGGLIYQGSEHRTEVPVSVSQTVGTFYVGSDIFQPRERGASLYRGTSGLTSGGGTDSATGRGTLTVAHTLTTYGLSLTTNVNSGLSAGSSSAASDTVIGPAGAHQITLIDTSGTGASGTVSLNGGPAVAWTNADANLAVRSPAGDIVYLDTRNITAGFTSVVDGNVPLTATGTLSSSGGPAVAITFSASQTVTDAAGGATHVNTTNARRTGTTQVNYTGTYDAFQALSALRDDLRNVNGLGSRDQIETLSGHLAELDRVRNNLLEVIGEQSANLQNLEGLSSHAEDVQLETRKLVTNLEGADLADVIIKLQSQENLFQLTLATSARLFDQSLLDFLR